MSSVGCLKVLVCVFCSWLNFNVLASNVGLYSVVAPGSIIPNRDFKVTVAVYHIKEPVTLKLAISGDSYNASQTVDLPTDREIKEVTFKVPDLSSGHYALTAEGVSGIKFQNSISLYYQHDAPVTIILIDKDDYIPGDKINYRVLVLNEQLRPDTYAEDVVICLLDPERNKVDKARKSKVSDGIYSGQFQLSKKAAHGQWELRLEDADGAEYGARTSTFTFFYVKPEGLPRFSVQIDTPKFVSIKENEMKIVLRAKHSYGNPLNGRAEIKIKLHTEKKKDNLYNRTITAKGAVVKGLATFHIDLTDIAKHIAPIQTTYIATIKAAVEDDDSGEVVTKTTYVYLLENRYIVTCADYSCQRPWKEKDNKVLIRITNLDGSLVSESKSPVKLIYSEGVEKMDYYFRKLSEVDEKKRFEFVGQLDKSGLYEFKANLSDFPKNDKYLAYYDISVAYKGEEHRIQQTIPQSMGFMIDVTNAYFTPRIDVDFFLQIHGRKNDKGFPAALVVGDEFRVTLNSNEPIKYFIYNIVARSLILHTERVEFDEPKTAYNFTLKATHLTAPHFNIYAYYVDDQGVLQHTKSQYKVLMSLANEMSITAPGTGHPEEDVKLRIRTEPNSYVGILAIDERILGRIKTDVIKHDNLDYHFYTNKLSNALSFDKPPTELPRNHDIDLSYLEDQLKDVHLHTYQDVPGSRLGLVTMTNAQIKERIFRYFDMDKDVSARSMSANNGKSALRYPLKPTETWLFSEIRKSQNEVTDLEIKLPDTLGTWIVKGFSLHPEKGLGIFQSNLTQIRTIKPYSLFVHLPYSVKLGETVRIPVLIVNHLPDPLKVQLALDNEANGFEDSLEYSQTQLVEIEEYGAKSVFFKFCPKYTGNFIPLDFRATSSVENTTFYKSLMVIEDKGRDIEYSNRAILVNLKDNQEYRSSFQFDLPNSRLVQFSLFTDPLGPILHNLDRSIAHGTGELTMSKMVVNFLVWNHLNRTKKLDEALDTRIKGNLREGYQNILNYLHEDGSFSYFDPPKANGSVWLTSYVLRYLGDIRSLIYIDRTILQKGYDFLLSRQHEDGSFTEDFKYFSRSGSSLFFTSSVLLALQKQATPNTVAINKAVSFLRSQLDETAETVSLAKSMAIYALQKSQSPESDKLVSQLRSVAMQENDQIWWTEDVQNGSPQDVEITSYALLALMASKVDKPESAISTVRWLLAQRNIHGDFESSQKTVVGLTALIEFAEKWGYQQNAWEVSISNEDISERLVACNLLTQTINFPLDTKRLEVRAKGTGAALIQISYGYDVEEKETEANPSFGIQTTLKSGSLSSKMELVVCVEFVERSTNASNMAVMELSLPSGYSADKSSFKGIRDVEGVGSVDTKNEDSVVIVYFESLAKNESKCIPVEAYRTLEVTNLKPSSVVIYDNYGRKATEYYQLKVELGDFKGT